MRSIAARGSLSLCLKLSLMPLDIRRLRTPVVGSGGGCDGPCERDASRVRSFVPAQQTGHTLVQSMCCGEQDLRRTCIECLVHRKFTNISANPEWEQH